MLHWTTIFTCTLTHQNMCRTHPTNIFTIFIHKTAHLFQNLTRTIHPNFLPDLLICEVSTFCIHPMKLKFGIDHHPPISCISTKFDHHPTNTNSLHNFSKSLHPHHHPVKEVHFSSIYLLSNFMG